MPEAHPTGGLNAPGVQHVRRKPMAMFNTPQLKGAAQEVEDTIVKIMKEAA